VLAGGTVADRLYGKMQNCRVDLALISQTLQLFPRLSFSLGDLAAWNGEAPSLMDMPGILPQGTTVDLLASLQDASAAVAPTRYGIVLAGAYEAV
jgi:hypothetical protein